MRFITLAASAILLTGGLAGCLNAQSSNSLDTVPPPLSSNDAFYLQLSTTVTIGNHVLPPGRYHCERLDIAGADLPVLTFRRDDAGEKPVYIAATIEPAFKQFAPAETSATYYHIGDRFYFDRIFVRGLNYGYRFELPKGVKKQEAESNGQRR